MIILLQAINKVLGADFNSTSLLCYSFLFTAVKYLIEGENSLNLDEPQLEENMSDRSPVVIDNGTG
jgi:hypothetical protein